ncbi:MAG: histidine kinase [Ekhidna sp.]|uniref:sensor histidine kinase n=1 Tax=Ekhidna sp. TaxID=2608089 RepID=UPI0032ECE2BE
MHLSWKSISLNLLFWLATGWLIASGFSIERQEIEIINDVETVKTVRNPMLMIKLMTYIGISALTFYLNLWNVRKYLKPGQKRVATIRSMILLMATIALVLTLDRFVIYDHMPFMLPFSLLSGIILFYFTISTAYGFALVWVQAEQHQRQLEVEKKQAELSLLRNQLQPHFLFNALNNFLSMVDQKTSPKLAQSFEQLSHLLRYVIEETKSDKVPIQREIGFLRNYVSLQLHRFEANEVTFNFEVKGEYTGQPVEPGLFIPFVENAFKYGTEPEKQMHIDLCFNLELENLVHFTMRNDHATIPALKGMGTGISSIEKRLDIVYPNRYKLEIKDQPDFFVDLKLETE